MGCTQVTAKEGLILALSNRVLARKLGYGVAYSDGAGEANDFVETAKSQLEYIPEFHPWKFIATHDQSKINLNHLRDDFQNDLDKRSKRSIQAYLKAQGYYKLSIDGDLGKGSRKAISAWQASISAPITGKLTKLQYSQIVLHQQRHGFVGELNLPDDLSDFSHWKLSQLDLRYPSDIRRAVKHRLELDDERERLRDLYAKGEIPDSEVQRLWWQRFNSFPWWRDTLTRALDNVHGQSPVLNRFWHFWINFFTVNVEACEGELYGSYYLTLRKHMTGKFEDLLYDAVWHPAMQEFLQNNQSIGPNSKRAKWMKEEGRIASINENLARELLELFTLTPSAGYTQDDVNNVAYILTGYGEIWSDDQVDSRYFTIEANEPGHHSVMGELYDQRPAQKLYALCQNLARDPRTGLNIATKLATHFISDEPPQEAIRAISEAYNSSGGDLIKVHKAVVDAVVDFSKEGDKFLQPEVWFFQVHKAISGHLPITFVGDTDDQHSPQINSILFELGHLNCRSPQPNGWSDLAIDWLTPEMMDRRLRYIGQIANRRLRSSGFDPHTFAERQFGVGSDVAKFVDEAPTFKNACIRLFCHPKFMRA